MRANFAQREVGESFFKSQKPAARADREKEYEVMTKNLRWGVAAGALVSAIDDGPAGRGQYVVYRR